MLGQQAADQELDDVLWVLYAYLHLYNNPPRLRNVITRAALDDPKRSYWRYLLRNGDDRAFLCTMSVDRQTFNIIYKQ